MEADGATISGETGQTLQLSNAQVGKRIQVTANYTDNAGNAENVTSTESSLVRGKSGYLFESSFE